jgi:CDGSH-type Zn-finger protein
MSEPVIADRKPCILELEPGTYFWCRCGKSAQQPWCDGAHSGTDFQPLEVKVTEKQRMALCLCKHTKHEPNCDGQHSRLP